MQNVWHEAIPPNSSQSLNVNTPLPPYIHALMQMTINNAESEMMHQRYADLKNLTCYFFPSYTFISNTHLGINIAPSTVWEADFRSPASCLPNAFLHLAKNVCQQKEVVDIDWKVFSFFFSQSFFIRQS